MPYLESWKEGVSKNSLDACHQFHCRDPGISQLELDKSDQKFFVNNPLPLIRDNFQVVINFWRLIWEIVTLETNQLLRERRSGDVWNFPTTTTKV